MCGISDFDSKISLVYLPKIQPYAPTVFGFFVESIQQMVTHMLGKNEISPTLNDILCHIDKDNRRSAQAFSITQNPDLPADAFDDNEVGLDFSSGRYDTATIEHDCEHERDDDIYVSHEDVNFGTFQSHQEVFYIAMLNSFRP